MGTVDPKNRGAVLLVDDDADFRAELKELLESESYFALECDDGQKALDVLRSAAASTIRLIVLDLVMPCMSGWELVDLLRRDTKLSRIPILVTSGMPVHGDASGIGATMCWIRKPFGEERFLEAVQSAIQPFTVSPEAVAGKGTSATASECNTKAYRARLHSS